MSRRRKKTGMRAEAYKQLDYILRSAKEIKISLSAMRRYAAGSYGHGDPTAITAINNCTSPKIVIIKNGKIIYNPEMWLVAIHQLYSAFLDNEQEIMMYFMQGIQQLKLV